MGPHASFPSLPFPSLVKAKVNGCPRLRMALNMNFLGWLAGTVFSKMICPGTFALSPGSPFPFFLSSMPLPSLLAHPPLMQGATFLSQHSHFCLTGHPSRGAPTHHSLTPFSILATGAVPGGSSLCPTLVYQKSGPFSQP